MSNFWKKIKKPFFVLAPMEDVTDHVFREIVANYLPKPDVMFTEFTNVEALNSEGFKKTIHRFKFSSIQKPIVAQIWGIKPENYYNTAKLISEMGFDGIDINMGCPIRAITKTGACSALINNKNLASEIIKATQEGSNNLPVSVKTRIGTKEVITEDWISFVLEHKLAALTVHGRTAKQMSTGLADWNEIKKAVELKNTICPDTIVIGNGDIKSRGDGLEKQTVSGVDGLMIGRGIFSNPWIFEDKITIHPWSDYKNVLLKHLELYSSPSETDTLLHYDKLKKFFKMYVNNFEGSKELRAKLMTTKTANEAINILKNV